MGVFEGSKAREVLVATESQLEQLLHGETALPDLEA